MVGWQVFGVYQVQLFSAPGVVAGLGNLVSDRSAAIDDLELAFDLLPVLIGRLVGTIDDERFRFCHSQGPEYSPISGGLTRARWQVAKTNSRQNGQTSCLVLYLAKSLIASSERSPSSNW